MKYLLRPMTELMIKHLLFLRNFQLSNEENNVGLEHFHYSLSGLIRRGYVDTKMVEINGKRLMSAYITESGIKALRNYEASNPSSSLPDGDRICSN